MGIETQRQWSDKAIARTTPVLLGLYSIVTLWAQHLMTAQTLPVRCSAWYTKECATFSDTLALVRRHLWPQTLFFNLPCSPRDDKSSLRSSPAPDRHALLCYMNG